MRGRDIGIEGTRLDQYFPKGRGYHITEINYRWLEDDSFLLRVGT